MPKTDMTTWRVNNVKQQAALTTSDTSTVDGVYGAEEQAVIGNLRIRVNEIEAVLQKLGILPS